MSSSEAALPSTRWRTDWWRLLEERDRISCQRWAAWAALCSGFEGGTHIVTLASMELVFHRRHWVVL